MILWELESRCRGITLQLRALTGEEWHRMMLTVTYYLKVIVNGHTNTYYNRDYCHRRDLEYSFQRNIHQMFTWVSQPNVIDNLIQESFPLDNRVRDALISGTYVLGNEPSVSQNLRTSNISREIRNMLDVPNNIEDHQRRWLNQAMEDVARDGSWPEDRQEEVNGPVTQEDLVVDEDGSEVGYFGGI